MSESLDRDVRESFREDIERITRGRVERERRQAELRANRQAGVAANNEKLMREHAERERPALEPSPPPRKPGQIDDSLDRIEPPLDRVERRMLREKKLIKGTPSVDLGSRPTREMPEARIRRKAIGIRIALAVVIGAVGLHELVGLLVPSLLHDAQTGVMCFAAVYFLSRIFVYTPKKPTERIVVGIPAVDLRARPSGEPLTVPIRHAQGWAIARAREPIVNRPRATKATGGRTVYVRAHTRRLPRR